MGWYSTCDYYTIINTRNSQTKFIITLLAVTSHIFSSIIALYTSLNDSTAPDFVYFDLSDFGVTHKH
jgi:hypothetical protein